MTLIDKHSNGRVSVISIGQHCQKAHMHLENCLFTLEIVTLSYDVQFFTLFIIR